MGVFDRLFGRRTAPPPARLDDTLRALEVGDAERPQPTLVCRRCGLKYENTGTFLRGAPCPSCPPEPRAPAG